MHRFLPALVALILPSLAFAPKASWAQVEPPPTVAAPATGKVAQAPDGRPTGYYRWPAIHNDLLVFVAEGDLWKVSLSGGGGGTATRLTSHAGEELTPAISPDGTQLAFTAQYEGPIEVYIMPLAGGLPRRLTWDNVRCMVSGWTPDGKILSSTERFSTLPNYQLTTIDPATGERKLIELAQASDGCYDDAGGGGKTLFFTRLPFQGSATKRYKGGTAQQLWKFSPGDPEATPLIGDFEGTTKRSQFWRGRVYFVTDRDGHMNVWSVTPGGQDLKQHTRHQGFDVQGGSLHNGKLAYQLGADLWVLDLATDQTRSISITLDTDLDQLRERWVEKPVDYLTSAHISPDGERIVITARGRIFVVPHRQGRIVDVARDDAVRYRNARFLPDALANAPNPGPGSLVALSDKTGEIELWKLPANGIGDPQQLTSDSAVLRWEAVPSPDGKLIAHHDKNQQLWIFDVAAKTNTRIDSTIVESFGGLTWSPDSRWLAYSTQADNMFHVVRIWSAESRQVTQVTTDRYDSYAPAWSTSGGGGDGGGGQWLYFLSDRTLRTVVGSPWGNNQPDPFLDEPTKIYALALKPGQRWPFQPKDELQKKEDKKEEKKEDPSTKETKGAKEADAEKNGDEKKDEKPADKKDEKKKEPKRVEIVLDGLAERLYEVPIPAGNYGNLAVTDKALFFISTPTAFERKHDLKAVEIKNEFVEAKLILADVNSYELSGDGKKLLIRKKEIFSIVDAAPSAPSDLEKKTVNLGGWTLSVIPRVQWRQMFIDSWRLMRDYFYDPDMHGVNWRAMLDKYLPLVDRVTTRGELNDLIAQMVAELSALHTFVRGGDRREAPDNIAVAALGGVLERDDAAGGWRITRIYQCEPDDPARTAPLAKPEVNANVGDVITMIDGVPTLSVPDYGMLLRAKAGKQVLIRIKSTLPNAQTKPTASAVGGPPANPDGTRDAVIVPFSQGSENDLRYTDWEYTRRLETQRQGEGKIGYVHLRAMGGANFTEWVKNFYPVFNRDGLIIDVRHNWGGNIDSWILGKLLRKAWFYWSQRVGNPPSWNMQYAFRGHMVVLCNERTASDGEAFAEGFRRLGLGKVIGTRTWGGEIWLSSSNVLVDKGIASAAETGVWGPGDPRDPERGAIWFIEGRGVEPDITVDNPPHSAFKGEDAQLKAAIEHLQQLMREKPIPPFNPPKKPDKSFENK